MCHDQMQTGEMPVRPRDRHTGWGTRSTILLSAVLVMAANTTGCSSRRPASQLLIAGYVSSSAALDSLEAARQGKQRTEISPVLYGSDRDGNVRLVARHQSVIGIARAMRVPIIPAIQNHRDGSWDGAMIALILRDERRRAYHVRQIVDAVVDNDWAGIDIDYEALPKAASRAYVAFIRQLSLELHRRHKLLTVDAPARSADAGEDDPMAASYDYAEVAAVVDEVRIMAYDHAWERSPPGPVAPARWVSQVLEFARRTVPADKLLLGIAAYGYDWVGARGTPLGTMAAARRAAAQQAPVHWDESSQSAWFAYTAAGVEHTVWFENAKAMIEKVGLARRAGIRGVSIWQFGGEDRAFWNLLGRS